MIAPWHARHFANRNADVTFAETRMLLIVQSFEPGQRITVREVAERAQRSASRTHATLAQLREKGLVEWSEGRRGTLQPALRPVPFGVPRRRRP